MTVGEYIKNLRREKEMSQRDLATATNLSNAEISRIESGIRKSPSPEALRSIAAALHIPIETLLELAGFIDKKTETTTSASFNPNDYICISDLTESEISNVKKYIAFLKSQR